MNGFDFETMGFDVMGRKRQRGEDLYQGRPRRTKQSHPYSYDPIVQWQGNTAKCNGSDYTDRLLMWDWDKHNDLCRKHFGNEGQHWSGREPKKIEAFLRDYHDDPGLELTQIVEYCNASTGYPVWRLDYYTRKMEAGR